VCVGFWQPLPDSLVRCEIFSWGFSLCNLRFGGQATPAFALALLGRQKISVSSGGRVTEVGVREFCKNMRILKSETKMSLKGSVRWV